jgi:hypothetical protein
MIRTIYWALYGEIGQAFPVMQLSNAHLTAIVRLDADESYLPDFQETTIAYLNGLAKTTGVVSVYGWVSAFAGKAGWQTLAPLGESLERLGGEIGTHSKTHFRSAVLSDSLAVAELDGSVAEIEAGVHSAGRDLGGVDFFINPRSTIKLTGYGKIADRFSIFMTHGFDEPAPLAYGNMTWFTGQNQNLIVVKDTPPSDWLWFYAPDWNYSTAEVVHYEQAIFDHLFGKIGRGVLFNQMWHDYSMHVSEKTNNHSWFSELRNYFSNKKKVNNSDRLPLYETLKEKFAAHDIYCPEPVELGHKLQIMAQANYAWKTTGDQVEVALDLREVDLDSTVKYTGGMGIRIENTGKKIRSVFIDGRPHFAFNDQVVILPDLNSPVCKLRISLTEQSSREPHLTYISKRMPSIRRQGEELETSIRTKSPGRFSFYVEKPFILLNADQQVWNRSGDNVLNGRVSSDRQLKLRKLRQHDFTVTETNIALLSLAESRSGVLLLFGKCDEPAGKIKFLCDRTPLAVHLNSHSLNLTRQGHVYELTLPEFEGGGTLAISF